MSSSPSGLDPLLPAISQHTLLLFIGCFFIPYASLFYLLHRHLRRKPARFGSALVLVLGDFGRSPRMMYHAKSLVQHGWETVVVAYGGESINIKNGRTGMELMKQADTEPIPSLLASPHIHFQYLSPLPRICDLLPWPIRAPLRLLHQTFGVLYRVLWVIPVHTEFIIVQNPPAIPTLLLAQLICRISGSKLIVDWHNEGWSVLAMRVGEGNPLVKVAKRIEGTFGQFAYAHLFVTSAMLSHLKKIFDLQGRPAILYDRPPSNFRRTDALQQHELFTRILPDLRPPLPNALVSPDTQSTAFTAISPDNLAKLRPDRPALLVSSTSWTADEDFSLLLTALDAYQAAASAAAAAAALPRLLVLITGKGPLRTAFERSVRTREASGTWTHITVRCLFVEARDYPTLLGCADLGVSLHTSTSGRDLPMKIVDMFGCGVPVLAKRFGCLGELVREGRNGRMFDTGAELGKEMIDLLSRFPENDSLNSLHAYFKAQAEKPASRASTPVPDIDEWTTWEKNWDRVVFKGILRRERR